MTTNSNIPECRRLNNNGCNIEDSEHKAANKSTQHESTSYNTNGSTPPTPINDLNVIDLGRIAKILWYKRKTFFTVLPIVAILSAIWIFPEPRYYEAEVSMAPESGNEVDMGGISGIASTFGINLGGDQTDAIYPMLYPELFESNEFIVGLFGIKVRTEDGKLTTDYYSYLAKHQKKNMLTWPVKQLFKQVKNIIFPDSHSKGNGSFAEGTIDPFCLSYFDFMLAETVKGKIRCSVDKKTNVITISVKDQDPLICATMADSLRCRLQDFITEYRTSKVRNDYKYYQKLISNADSIYNASVEAYAKYCDTHQNVTKQTFMSQRDNLENDMQMKYQTMLGLKTQLETAKAKVQARTPVFTTLRTATVPVKPAGPKRVVFILGMCIMATISLSFWLARKEIFSVD